MKEMTKDEISEQLGSNGFWSPTPVMGDLKYAGGLPPFDRIQDESSLDSNPVTVFVRPDGWEFQMYDGLLSKVRVGLHKERAGSTALERAETIREKKDKSVVGRALAGGVLFGPVGAVVGGMTGMKDKEVDRTPDSFLTIHTSLHDEPAVFTVENDDIPTVADFFRSHYPGEFRVE